MELFDLAVLLPVIGVLTVLTNLIVEVIKKAVSVHANLVAIVTAEILTIGSFLAYMDINKIQILWYYVAAAFVVGIMVAYAAMFGFDKLKQVLESVKTSK